MVNTTAGVNKAAAQGGGLRLASLNHISVVCRSLESSLAFYCDVLGFFPIRRPGSFDFDGAWLFNFGIGVHLLQAEDPEGMPPMKTEIDPKDNHISFTVFRALERFKAVHKKGYHMVHCWEKLEDTQKWEHVVHMCRQLHPEEEKGVSRRPGWRSPTPSNDGYLGGVRPGEGPVGQLPGRGPRTAQAAGRDVRSPACAARVREALPLQRRRQPFRRPVVGRATASNRGQCRPRDGE